MRTTTWTEVQEDIRQRYDLPSFTTTTFITSTAVLRMANQSLQRRDALLAECFGDEYRATSGDYTTTANQQTFTLPADFLRLTRLIWRRNTDDPVVIERADIETYSRLSTLAATSWSTRKPYYRFAGTSQLYLLPTPNAVYNLTLLYSQTAATLTTGSDTIQDGPAWTEWLVADVCAKIAQRFEDDPSVYMAERADAEQKIRAQAPDRDESASVQVRDTYGTGRLGDQELRDRLTLGDW